MIQIIQKESEQIWCLYYQNATRYLTIRLKTSVKTIRLSWRFLFLERGDLLGRTRIAVTLNTYTNFGFEDAAEEVKRLDTVI